MMTEEIVRTNISSLFLIPILRIREELRSSFTHYGFVGSYIECLHLTYDFNPVYLLFKPEDFVSFLGFSTLMERNQNYVETLDLPDGMVLFVYKIPNRFEADLERLKKGRYVHLSPEFKSCFQTKKYMQNEFGAIKRGMDGRPITGFTVYHYYFTGTNLDGQSYREEEETLIWN